MGRSYQPAPAPVWSEAPERNRPQTPECVPMKDAAVTAAACFTNVLRLLMVEYLSFVKLLLRHRYYHEALATASADKVHLIRRYTMIQSGPWVQIVGESSARSR